MEFKNDISSLGYEIEVYQESINKPFPEFLVNFDYFIEVMERFGFALLSNEESQEIGLPNSIGSFEELFTSMKDEITRNQKAEMNYGTAASMSPEEAERIAIKTAKESLSIKDLNSLVSKKTQNKTQKDKQKNTDLLNIEKEMSESFGHKIEIETKNKNSGKVSISYNTLDELDNIIAKIKNK